MGASRGFCGVVSFCDVVGSAGRVVISGLEMSRVLVVIDDVPQNQDCMQPVSLMGAVPFVL